MLCLRLGLWRGKGGVVVEILTNSSKAAWETWERTLKMVVIRAARVVTAQEKEAVGAQRGMIVLKHTVTC